jgi:prolipoprotein diacylglyceryl transferase
LWVLTRFRKISFLQILDILAPPMILAQAIGRLGNYFNQELFGLPTDLPWGLTISDSIATRTFCEPNVYCSAGLHYHPTFLYEMLWNIAGFALLLFLERRLAERLRTGQLFCLYVIYYAIGRIWIEALRINYSTYFLGLRINIWGAIAAGLTAFLLFVYLNKRQLRAAT